MCSKYTRHALVCVAESRADLAVQVKLLPGPDGNGLRERAEPHRGDCHACLPKPLEHQERLFIEGDVVDLAWGDAGLRESELNRVRWESLIVFASREPLLPGGGWNPTVGKNRGGGVVMKSGDA